MQRKQKKRHPENKRQLRNRYRITTDPNQVTMPFKVEDPFSAWARSFFRGRLNRFIPYSEAISSYRKVNLSEVRPLQFKRALASWCARSSYQLDPPDLWNSARRIIRKKNGVATEMLYIRSVK